MANPLARLALRAAAAAGTRQIASRVSGSHLGPIGNVAAIALPFVLSRVSPLGLAALAVGAWGVGKLARSIPESAPAPAPTSGPTSALPAPLVTPPPIAWNPPPDGL